MGFGGWGWHFSKCEKCGASVMEGAECKRCPPDGMVTCPATHKTGSVCPLCKGSGFVPELT